MTLVQVYGVTSIVILTYAVITWLLTLQWNARVPDGVWGLGMIVATAAYAIMGSGVPTRTALIAMLVLAWGLRLSLHMWWRARRGLGSPSYELTRADRSP